MRWVRLLARWVVRFWYDCGAVGTLERRLHTRSVKERPVRASVASRTSAEAMPGQKTVRTGARSVAAVAKTRSTLKEPGARRGTQNQRQNQNQAQDQDRIQDRDRSR